MTTTIREPITAPRKGRSDAELQRLILDELRWDSDVREASVGVEVDRRVVTLTGTVGSFGEKMAAQRVEGVLDVANDLHINYGPHPVADDTRIAQLIRRALEADLRIPEKDIRVTVNQGLVILEGTVRNGMARYRAEQAVENIVGVHDVANCILVQPTLVRETDIQAALEQALERQAMHRAKRIQIDFKDGVVTLNGTVRSWPEREAAYQSASHAPGVRSLVNRLRIDPYA